MDRTASLARTVRRAGCFAGLALIAAAAAAQTNTVGLSTVRGQRFGNVTVDGVFTPQTADYFGIVLATGDFNADGAEDIATGMPYDNGAAVSPIDNSGSVVVRYGAVGAGLAGPPVYLRHRDVTEADDRLGWSLAACDLNADGYEDLAAGMPTEDYLGALDAGIVQVHFGHSSGLPEVADTFFARSTPGVPGDVGPYHRFGWSLACADFDGDGYDDLAVGVPGTRHHYDPLDDPLCPPGGAGCKINVGQVILVPGAVAGLDFARSTWIDQESPGMPNGNDDGDNFGHSLVAADFNGDGYGDLAVGTIGEDDRQGAVGVVFGSSGGLRTDAGSLMLGENVLGGTREDDDMMGWSLAAGDLDDDGYADLVIGFPYEDGGSEVVDSGQVAVVHGFAGGLDLGRAQLWTEDQVFGSGVSESGDLFGHGLAVGDFDKDGYDDLAIGHPGEVVFGVHDGAATILMGSADGVTGLRRRSLAAGVQGLPGDAQTGEQLGHALAAGDFDGEGHADLVIGSPAENEGGIADVGAETVLYGALFADGVESGNTALWPQTAFVANNNTISVTTAARLGPPISRRGIQLDLISPSFRQPAFAAFVRVGPEAGFASEPSLVGEFFINPQSLTMSTSPGANGFQFMAFTDGVAAGAKTWLVFNLVRNTADGDWFLNVQHFNEETGTFQFSGGGFFALDATPSFSNNRIEFVWESGSPGRLTMWRTRFLNGAPDASGRIVIFTASLPGMRNAVINHAFAGMFAGHDAGTFGPLYLDEISFRRFASPSQSGSSPTPGR